MEINKTFTEECYTSSIKDIDDSIFDVTLSDGAGKTITLLLTKSEWEEISNFVYRSMDYISFNK